jgi:hypothetical protein
MFMRNSKASFLFVMAIAILVVSSAVFAIGASPASFDFPQLLRGGYAEQVVVISNPSDSDIAIRMGGEGETGEWISAEPSEFILAPRSSGASVIKVEPPMDIANGDYRGNILVIGSPLDTGDGQISIMGGVSLVITAEITDTEIKDYEIRKVQAQPTEECRPIEVVVRVANIGNVRVNGDFTLVLKKDDKIFHTKDYSTEEMLPTHEYTYLIDLPYELEQYDCIPVGQYVVEFVANLDGKEIFSQDLPLTISERGSLRIEGILTNIRIPENVDIGQLVQVRSDFENNGELTYRAQLAGDIYSGGILSDTVKGDAVEVLKGENKEISFNYRINVPGDYEISVYAVDSISGAKTDEQQFPINVAIPALYLIGGLLLIVIILVVLYLKFFKGKKMEKSDVIVNKDE